MNSNSQSFDQTTEDITTRLDVSLAREHLSDALHNYISAKWAEASAKSHTAKDYRIPSNFECLILCQYACAGKSGVKCIWHSIKVNPEDRALHAAVTFGRMLNVEKGITKC